MHNLTTALLSFVVFVATVFVAAKLGKPFLFGLSITFILISNYTIQMSVEIIPGVTISWGIIIYSLVYLITDLLIEFYGRAVAYQLAASNLAVQILMWFYVYLSLQVTPIASGHSSQIHATLHTLFSTTAQVTLAAVIAAIGPVTDVFVTGRIRDWLRTRRVFRNNLINLLARTKLSTLLGEVINTALFFSIALIGTSTPTAVLLSIVITTTAAKWAISLADAPFLWLFFQARRPPARCRLWEHCVRRQ